MLITVISIKRTENGSRMKGVANLTIDDMLAIHDIKIIANKTFEKEGQLFLAMPSRLTKFKTFEDIVHPINAEVRGGFERLILGAYRMAIQNQYDSLTLTLKEEKKAASFANITLEDYQTVQHSSLSKRVEVPFSMHEEEREVEQTEEELLKWLEG